MINIPEVFVENHTSINETFKLYLTSNASYNSQHNMKTRDNVILGHIKRSQAVPQNDLVERDKIIREQNNKSQAKPKNESLSSLSKLHKHLSLYYTPPKHINIHRQGKPFSINFTSYPDLELLTHMGQGHLRFVTLNKVTVRDFVVATAASWNYVNAATFTVASTQKYLPGYHIIFYTLGSVSEAKIAVVSIQQHSCKYS